MDLAQLTLAFRRCELADPQKYPQSAQKANSYHNPIGIEPGVAYVLMQRRWLDTLAMGDALMLQWSCGGNATAIPLWFVQAHNISGGPAGDPDRVHLVELADRRRIMRMGGVTLQFNLRAGPQHTTPATDLTQPLNFHSESLQGGALWTWDEMLAELWDNLPATVGSPPVLPYSPTDPPVDWQFYGSALEGIQEVLHKLGCDLAYDPVLDAFSYVRLGAPQLDALAAEALNVKYLDDATPLDGVATNIPATIRVCFPRSEVHYGIERTTSRADNWLCHLTYKKEITTGVAGAVSGTSITLWDDLPAFADYDGALVNESAINARASARATEWLRDAQHVRGRKMYSGLHPEFKTGSDIKEVLWRAWDSSPGGEGLITEVVRRPTLSGRNGHGSCGHCGENLSPPDVVRRTFPLYPPPMQLVKCVDGEGTFNNLFDGILVRYDIDTGDYREHETVWLAPTDRDLVSITADHIYIGRLNGSIAAFGGPYPGQVRPLYMIDQAGATQQVYRATLGQSLTRGGSAPATTVGGAAITVRDWNFIPIGKTVPNGTRVFVMLDAGEYWLMEINICLPG